MHANTLNQLHQHLKRYGLVPFVPLDKHKQKKQALSATARYTAGPLVLQDLDAN